MSEDIAMDDFGINEMLEMQKALQDELNAEPEDEDSL